MKLAGPLKLQVVETPNKFVEPIQRELTRNQRLRQMLMNFNFDELAAQNGHPFMNINQRFRQMAMELNPDE
jgi:hypothetical protein